MLDGVQRRTCSWASEHGTCELSCCALSLHIGSLRLVNRCIQDVSKDECNGIDLDDHIDLDDLDVAGLCP